jgi:hypothetical protein
MLAKIGEKGKGFEDIGLNKYRAMGQCQISQGLRPPPCITLRFLLLPLLRCSLSDAGGSPAMGLKTVVGNSSARRFPISSARIAGPAILSPIGSRVIMRIFELFELLCAKSFVSRSIINRYRIGWFNQEVIAGLV